MREAGCLQLPGTGGSYSYTVLHGRRRGSALSEFRLVKPDFRFPTGRPATRVAGRCSTPSPHDPRERTSSCTWRVTGAGEPYDMHKILLHGAPPRCDPHPDGGQHQTRGLASEDWGHTRIANCSVRAGIRLSEGRHQMRASCARGAGISRRAATDARPAASAHARDL